MSFRKDIDHIKDETVVSGYRSDNLGFDSFRVTTAKAFKAFYNNEALTFEEWRFREGETISKTADRIKVALQNRGFENPEVYWFKGSDINDVYHLTGSNAYRVEHIMFIVPWKLSEFNPAPYKSELGMRYFADVIDNNARREIWKSNSFYVDYHSLYGDEWFWSTVEELKSDPSFLPEY